MPQYTQPEMKVKLKDYLPALYYDIIDIDELLDTESFEMSTLWGKVEEVFLETFSQTMSLVGILRWESILNITPSISSTTEDRRSVIQTKLYVKNKATFVFLESVISVYGTIDSIIFNDTTSTAELSFSGTTTSVELYLKVREIIPAHLLIDYIFTISKEVIGIKEEIFATDITRNTKLGVWTLGNTPFASAGSEVKYK